MIAARSLHFIAPGELRGATGGYVYDRRMAAGLRELGWQVTVHSLDASFPHPSDGALQAAQALLALLPDEAMVLIDGLALGAMPELLRAQAARLLLLGLIHLPLAAEVGLPPERARELRHSEGQALQSVRHVIVTSGVTAQMLVPYGVPTTRLSVIEPGVDEVRPAPRRARRELQLLCVASISRGKGQQRLIEALAGLASRDWQLTCVGTLTHDPRAVAQLRASVVACGLSERVQLVGEVEHEALAPYFLNADVFVLATQLETYCMAVAEALAYGLPVVATRTGAIAELIGGGAGLLVPPDDTNALQTALERVLSEPGLLATLAMGAAAARARLVRWPQRCEQLSDLLARLAAQPPRALAHASETC